MKRPSGFGSRNSSHAPTHDWRQTLKTGGTVTDGIWRPDITRPVGSRNSRNSRGRRKVENPVASSKPSASAASARSLGRAVPSGIRGPVRLTRRGRALARSSSSRRHCRRLPAPSRVSFPLFAFGLKPYLRIQTPKKSDIKATSPVQPETRAPSYSQEDAR